jgi:hypothetical protein
LYFTLASVFSGLGITGQAAGISGRRSTDGGSQILLSGSISEIGGGQYVANLFDWDTSGNYIGYLFTASGTLPVSFSVTTVDAFSGSFYFNSGAVTLNASGQLSGQLVGFFSGQQVNVYSGQISGYQVNTLQNFDKSGYWLNASGLDPITVESGINFRQAQAIIMGAEAGMVSGAGTTLFSIGNMSGILRIVSIVDQSGNRASPLILTPPQ